MTTKQAIEAYIEDWHYDEKSKIFAYELGKFIFSFIRHLESSNLSPKTIKEHISNAWFIGDFECRYGLEDDFEIDILTDGPHHENLFERKVNDSKYALQSYATTWRKLDKFIKSREYVGWMKRIEEELNQEK